tara:strand:+ start:164 stop:1681 length:1518 start_codon:yes stop_codon:yes gene_type:complete
MLKVYNGGQACYIRPVPLISISETPVRNKAGTFSTQYNIILNGTLIAHGGSPIYKENGSAGLLGGPNGNFAISDTIPTSESLPSNQLSRAILSKQSDIRALFQDHQKIEICGHDGTVIHTSNPIVESINFEEGTYVDICRFTVNLVAYNIGSGTIPSGSPSGIEDFNDSWSIESDDTFGQHSFPKAYRITRNLSATAINSGDGNSWKYAKEYLLQNSASVYANSGYPDPNGFASGSISIPESYSGVDFSRTENIDIAAGSYTLSDTWLLMDSGSPAIENSNISIQAGIDNAFTTVSIDGTIKGVNTGGGNALTNAQNKYLDLSNSGQFGVGCDIFKRVDNRVAHKMNSQPTSISLGLDEGGGQITYNLEFNNRPVNVFTGVISETININDTYPGDTFAIVPILGRTTGPLLQYTGSRTEYRRDVGIEIILDASDIGYGDTRGDLILRKPSVNEPIRTELTNLIKTVSPASEKGVKRYFLSAPTESWNPKTGSYSLNLSWTYELDK